MIMPLFPVHLEGAVNLRALRAIRPGPLTAGLKVLEDRTLVKYHANCEFVKLPYEKDGEAAKKWGVTQVPAILVCDPMERVLERLAGKKQPIEVKAAILKAVHKADEQDRASRR